MFELHRSTWMHIFFNKYLYCFNPWLEVCGYGQLTAYTDLCHFLKDFIYSFLERGKRRQRGRETSVCERDLAHNPVTCPDWESNQQFGLQASTRSTEPHQPGWSMPFYTGDLSICGFGYLPGGLEPIPHRYWGTISVLRKSKVIHGVSTVGVYGQGRFAPVNP